MRLFYRFYVPGLQSTVVIGDFHDFPEFVTSLLQEQGFPVNRFEPVQCPEDVIVIELRGSCPSPCCFPTVRPHPTGEEDISENVDIVVRGHAVPVAVVQVRHKPFGHGIDPGLYRTGRVITVHILEEVGQRLEVVVLDVLLVIGIFDTNAVYQILVRHHIFSEKFRPLSRGFVFRLENRNKHIFLFHVSTD